MKTKIVMFFALAVGFLTAASVQAVPITYDYFGLPFTDVTPPYTTRDFVKGILTFASPLPANLSIATHLTPLSFTFSDGHQTLTEQNSFGTIRMGTTTTGAIYEWDITVQEKPGGVAEILTAYHAITGDAADRVMNATGAALNINQPSGWEVAVPQASDTGSTLSLMTLTLMALGVGARRLKWAAA